MQIGQPVLVVGINYRLGMLGFFTSKELRQEARDRGEAGYSNLGFHDQRLALQWVRVYPIVSGKVPPRPAVLILACIVYHFIEFSLIASIPLNRSKTISTSSEAMHPASCWLESPPGQSLFSPTFAAKCLSQVLRCSCPLAPYGRNPSLRRRPPLTRRARSWIQPGRGLRLEKSSTC